MGRKESNQTKQTKMRVSLFTLDRLQSKTMLLTNVNKKSLETEFLIVACRPTVDKRQSKTLFLAIFIHDC